MYSAIISRYPHQKFFSFINTMIFQVVAVAGFTPVEEVERISMGPRDMVGRVVRDFCREGWVGDQSISTSMVGLAGEVELGDGAEEGEEEEDTPGEAADILF